VGLCCGDPRAWAQMPVGPAAWPPDGRVGLASSLRLVPLGGVQDTQTISSVRACQLENGPTPSSIAKRQKVEFQSLDWHLGALGDMAPS
jgi:hypothetical protein